MFAREPCREVIRIKVKKCDGLAQPEYKKLCVDPELTSFEILQHLLVKAFNIKGDFTISYLGKDGRNQNVYLSLLSDWDLDAAFLSASDPVLKLKVDLKPFEEGLEDWDVVAPVDIPQRRLAGLMDKSSLLGQWTEQITSQVGRTVSQVTKATVKAIGLKPEESQQYKPTKLPMSDSEFHNFLDGVGTLIKPQEFRLSVYHGGVEPSLRRVVWRHLLNVYPDGMTGRTRYEYLNKKTDEYYKLRDAWRELFSQGKGTEELKFVTNMVKKDVLRTDRTHPFYAGSDDNKHVLMLFNILVTYALTHPSVSYCQGMSDIASPLLVVETDEASAYICLCGAMNRLKTNFLLDGEVMTEKFKHLVLLLQHHDPVFYEYLKRRDADDMFFCYRWLLLELKREFPFDNALYMLEVMWSSLPPDPPESEIQLTERSFSVDSLMQSPSSPTLPSSAYMRLKHLRRPASTVELKETEYPDSPIKKSSTANEALAQHAERPTSVSISVIAEPDNCKLHKGNGDVTPVEEDKHLDPKEFIDMRDSLTRDVLDRSCSIDRSLENGVTQAKEEVMVNGVKEELQDTGDVSQETQNLSSGNELSAPEPKHRSRMSDETQKCLDEIDAMIAALSRESSPTKSLQRSESLPESSSQDPADASKQNCITDGNQDALTVTANGITERSVTLPVSTCEEVTEGHPSIDFVKVHEKPPRLPPPSDFGCGNPFLMFMCLTLLLQQRDHIIRHRMDYNDLAMHFDRMVRKHSVHKVLHQAKQMYSDYLRSQNEKSSENSESDDVSV